MENSIVMWPYNGIALDEGTVWFVAYEYSVLVQYDLALQEVVKVIIFDDSSIVKDSHYNVICCGDYVVLVPGWSKKIIVYDKITENIQRIELEDTNKRMELFSEVAIWNDNIFFFPIEYGRIVKLNLSEMEIAYFDIVDVVDSGNIFTVASQQIGSMVYIKLFDNQYLYMYNLQTQEGKKIRPSLKEEYNLLCQYTEDSLLLKDEKGALWSFNCIDFSTDKIEGVELDENIVRGIKCNKGYLLFSRHAEDSLLYLNENQVHRIKLTEACIGVYEKFEWEYNAYSRPVSDGSRVIFFDMFRRMMCELNMEEWDLEMKHVYCSKEKIIRRVSAIVSDYSELVQETLVYDLSTYIENLLKK